MKTLDKKAFGEIRSWLHRNGREIECALWQFHFEDGTAEAVLSTLAFYQNEDGGFGNALEPDSWNPDSSPYTTLYAITLLRGIRFTDTSHPVYQGIFRFLENGMHSTEKSWLFSIPSNDACPRAPWWTYNEASNETESVGVTAGLAGFILRYGDVNSALYEKALDCTQDVIDKLNGPGPYGDMGIGEGVSLLADMETSGAANKFDGPGLAGRLAGLMENTVERDPSKWTAYNAKPSLYIGSPDSVFFPAFKELVSAELDFIIDTRRPGAVWDIPWNWFEHAGKYAREWAISENWWKSVKAIEKTLLLRDFGRVQ
ncbi:hypothetical protein K7I13_03475 [Brucepastera parasyntrophica]|uniref:hypothetical protein n=1 Tax=Brucepastera parasyntrophica TaxID=2880008 RepID=UPI00210DF5AB|nr:hypothetical protein [Brucepastera parasyntrophica]ULQ60381.1 hypothetical protein K7I13_03475 [Brucepastera parasyntrophica]